MLSGRLVVAVLGAVVVAGLPADGAGANASVSATAIETAVSEATARVAMTMGKAGLVSVAAMGRQPVTQSLPARLVEFAPEAPEFEAAAAAYREIWSTDGSRIVAVFERLTGLPWESAPIRAIVFEGTSHSGYVDIPMRLRASYPLATKQGTLVHELGHRIFSHLVPGDADDHPLLFLFLYDAWVELWGKEFADEQVKIESARKGQVDYAGTWRAALAMTALERAARWRSFVASGRPGR